jgi:hypothetical protein
MLMQYFEFNNNYLNLNSILTLTTLVTASVTLELAFFVNKVDIFIGYEPTDAVLSKQ